MLVLGSLIALAVLLPVLLALLHRQGLRYLLILVVAILLLVVAGVTILGSALETEQKIGIAMLFAVPVASVFLFSLLIERPIVVAVGGLLVFVLGFFVALSLSVGLGLLQP